MSYTYICNYSFTIVSQTSETKLGFFKIRISFPFHISFPNLSRKTESNMGRKIDEVHEKKLTYKKNTLVGKYFAFKNYELSIKNLEF